MDGLLSRVPTETSESGPDWLKGLREEASRNLREHGFPSKKHEKWRFTSVREVVDTPFETAESTSATSATSEETGAWVAEQLGDDGTARVVLTDGVPALGAALPEGVTVRSLAEVLKEAPETLEGVLGQLAPREHFAALNAALFTDGVVIELKGHVEVPVHLVHVAAGGSSPRASYPRVVVVARKASQARVVESFLTREGEARHLTNTVAEITLEPGARLEHVRITEGTPTSLQLAQCAVRLDRDAFYGSRVVALGGALTRLELGVRFDGPGAEVELDGAYHVGGTDHVDHQVTVEHIAGHCQSHVRYRGLLDGKGHAVFNAIGIVKRDAAGSGAHQQNRNLLLSDGATLDTKPHLEIDCDEVSASHGTTVGALDDKQLFYFRSRGIPESQARDILTYAFVREILDAIGHAPLVKRMSEAALDRLPHGASIRELVE